MKTQAKDFQRITAERILHIYKQGHRRVLLADEVGLGKTFVAQQVVSLIREWHREQNDDLFKVVYICSNANIADQNIEKLGVAKCMSISESRLSMQHLHIALSEKDNRTKGADGDMPESIIPLTPSTSFRFFSSQGKVQERALIYDILKHMNVFKQYDHQLSKFLSCNVIGWSYNIEYYDKKIKMCGEEYLANMIATLEERLSNDLIEKIINLATTNATSKQRAVVINNIRRIFAEISIDMLDPDLVVMDEFQRFNTLLEQRDDEQSMLANRFFNTNKHNTNILLLSATPYKPYSTLEELNADGCDEHYRDFMKVIDFLFTTKDSADKFKLIWQHYSDSLKRTEVTDLTPLLDAKKKAEESLYRVMCRTERFNSGIIDDSGVTDIEVLPGDILSYAQGQHLIDSLEDQYPDANLGNFPIEYVKSAPYLLSFMDKYELKKRLTKLLAKTSIRKSSKNEMLLLSRSAINKYQKIDPGNGKLKYLHDHIFGMRQKSHLLLWVPTSHPYYKAGGLFESEDAKKFSKIILFSSWEMVPRMVSVMMSYYSELYTLGALKNRGSKIQYTSHRKKRYGEDRLRKDGLLEYPCQILASLYSPERYYSKDLAIIKKDIKTKISNLLAINEQISSLPQRARGNAKHILSIMQLLDGVPLESIDDLYVPANTLDVLTDITIASPAVCAYRQSQDIEDSKKVAKAIVSIFNKPESAAIIDIIYNKKSDEDYYESVLDYCVNGNLQAVLDEYAHMLNSNCIGNEVAESIIDTSHLTVDTSSSIGDDNKKQTMRCHFAIPFIDKTITDKSVARTTNIRKAFNSPFRPFILSTTSIGQEGLDFHFYARKIVHWNLPSNPVDLEQREGRINRYKCLAIRRNVAKLFASDEFKTWDDLFAEAYSTLKSNHSDIVPYWCLPIKELTPEQRDKLQYIERIVPLYPLSRDRYRYERLIKVLALYRMTLGQPRQEELLNLLKEMNLTDEQLKELTIDLCPYNKEMKINCNGPESEN